ncbi:MAG TPA: c-type cytochrome, partial [Verrucomicrobia bacterium]|nr:c-type cytochrome [Verrucomicrobiota bacterium]
FDRADPHSIQWTNIQLRTRPNSENPWGIRSRKSSDGDERSLFFDSLLHGEKLTGILRSKDFGLPAEFSFYLAGHMGYPNRADPPRNFVRIRDAKTGEILQEVHPPRNDIAQKFTMDLSGFKGRPGYLEVEDGDSQGAFAWMAIGRFDPPLIIVAEPSPRKSEKRNLEGCRLAADLGLSKYFPQTTSVLVDSRQPLANRIAAADACIKLNRDKSFIHLEEILKDSRESIRLRARIATVLGGMNHKTAIRIMMETLSILPERMQVPLASAASSSTEGANALLAEVEAGRVSARLLQRTGLRRRIEAAAPPDWENRLNLLTEDLFPVDETLKMTIASRLTFIGSHQGNISNGRQVYEKNCAACHQFKNEGNLVGPQLDGIGNRGNERLLEDIIDPNSNVDVTFRYSLYTLKDDQLISGLFRRQEGDLLILVDSTGKELEIPSNEVVSKEVSEYSLMPENFGEILTAENLSDLLAFLTGE